jgi:hypothetical protein
MALPDLIPGTPANMSNDPNEQIGNTTAAISEIFEDDFKALLALLAERNMKPGKFLGAGSVGVAYELETLDGKKLDSAVIRFDPEGAVGRVDTAATIEQIATVTSENFSATIVPKAQKWELDKDELKQSLAILNAEGAFPKLTDMKPDQFMKVPGIDVPVMTDLTSMRQEGRSDWGGSIEELCDRREVQIDAKEVMAAKASPDVVEKIRGQKEQVGKAVRAELAEKGINIEAVPSKQTVQNLEPGVEQVRGTIRG